MLIQHVKNKMKIICWTEVELIPIFPRAMDNPNSIASINYYKSL